MRPMNANPAVGLKLQLHIRAPGTSEVRIEGLADAGTTPLGASIGAMPSSVLRAADASVQCRTGRLVALQS